MEGGKSVWETFRGLRVYGKNFVSAIYRGLTLEDISTCTWPRMSLECTWYWETLVSKMAWAMESELGYVKGKRDIGRWGCSYNY